MRDKTEAERAREAWAAANGIPVEKSAERLARAARIGVGHLRNIERGYEPRLSDVTAYQLYRITGCRVEVYLELANGCVRRRAERVRSINVRHQKPGTTAAGKGRHHVGHDPTGSFPQPGGRQPVATKSQRNDTRTKRPAAPTAGLLSEPH